MGRNEQLFRFHSLHCAWKDINLHERVKDIVVEEEASRGI